MVSSSAASFNPFAAPVATPIGAVCVRDRVAVAGTVTDLSLQHWVGGTTALHATVTDDTGSLVVAFLGRPRVEGVEIGRAVTVGGAVIRRQGRPLIMNPHLWLIDGAPSIHGPASDGRALVDA